MYPDPLIIMKDYQGESLSFIIDKSASSWADTINRNIKTMNSRESGFRWMLRFIISGLRFLVIAFIVFALCMLGYA